MSVNTLIGLTLFTMALAWSPGPVNILLLALGVNHGVRKNIPFVGGLICSASVVSLLCMIGLQIVLQNAVVRLCLSIGGASYIFYLAIKLYRLQPTTTTSQQSTHGFVDGLLVTLLNPKFYAMVISIFAQYISPAANNIFNSFIVCFVFICVLTCAHGAWLLLGKMLGARLTHSKHLGLINKSMGMSLFLFALYFLYKGISSSQLALHAWSS